VLYLLIIKNKQTMSISKVLIQTQYLENYSESNVPYWKKKGSQTFEIEIEADLLMYSNPAEIFTEMLKKHCCEYQKYEYIAHDILFNRSISIGSVEEYKSTYHSLNTPEENV